MMKDIRLTIKARNNRLLTLIEEQYGSQAEFSRRSGVNYQMLSGLVTMRETPINQSGWTRPAEDIAAALGVYPSDIWPEHMQHVRLAQSTASVSLDMSEALAIAGSTRDGAELVDMIAKASDALNEREAGFLRWLMDGNMDTTLDERGAYLGVTRERARQIEIKAFRKMRNRLARHGIDAENVLASS